MEQFLRLLVRGQYIDRRILYLLLAFVIAVPFIPGIKVPVPAAMVLPDTQKFYDTIEEMANDPARRDKLVILSASYGAGTLADNQTQLEAAMQHLMKKKLKFAIFAFSTPQGREQGQLAADKFEKKYGYVYGENYVNFGYRPSDAIVPLLKAAVRDVPGAFGNDVKGTPLAQVPVMKNIKTVNDVGLIIEVASSQTLPAWIQYYQRTGDQPIPTLYCPTAVMAPEAYPYLKSGQLSGMMNGLKGAIEYEGLIGERGFGSSASASLSYSHLLIILMVVLGNAGMFAARYLEKREGNA